MHLKIFLLNTTANKLNKIHFTNKTMTQTYSHVKKETSVNCYKVLDYNHIKLCFKIVHLLLQAITQYIKHGIPMTTEQTRHVQHANSTQNVTNSA